jgi:hypothetical protein
LPARPGVREFRIAGAGSECAETISLGGALSLTIEIGEKIAFFIAG